MLHRLGPHRHGAVLIVPAFPAKGLGLGQGLENQVHPLQKPGPALCGIHAVHLVFGHDASHERGDDPPAGENVQHPDFLGGSNGIEQRQQLAQEGDFGRLAPFGHGRRHDHRVGRGPVAGVVVLRQADPVKAQRFGEFALLHAILVGLHRNPGVLIAGGSGPTGGVFMPFRIPHRTEIRCLH